MGVEVLSINIDTQINLKSLHSGLYFIQFTTNQQKYYFTKFIKKERPIFNYC